MRREFGIDRVGSEVDDRAVSPDIEDGVVVVYTHFGKCLRRGELLLDGFVFEEGDTLFIVLVCLGNMSRSVQCKLGRERTSTEPGSTGGFGPLGEAKSISAYLFKTASSKGMRKWFAFNSEVAYRSKCERPQEGTSPTASDIVKVNFILIISRETDLPLGRP